MTTAEVKRRLKEANAIEIGNYLLFSDLELYNQQTKESTKYSSLEDLMDKEKEVGKVLISMTAPAYSLNGGRGASSGSSKTFKFSTKDNRRGKDVTTSDLVAKVNRTYDGNKMSEANTLNRFVSLFKSDTKEHAFVVDNDGFVQQFRHGGKNYVTFSGGLKGNSIIHNHPSSSTFSGANLKTFATSGARSIVAVGKQGSYKLTATGRFDAKGFTKMLNTTAEIKGSSYNDAMGKWLKKNAKTYGYQYEYVKHSG